MSWRLQPTTKAALAMAAAMSCACGSSSEDRTEGWDSAEGQGGPGCYPSLGETLCRAAKSSGCHPSMAVPEAVCNAGGGSGCYASMSLGEALCKAGGGSGCHASMDVSEASCRAALGPRCYSPSNVACYQRLLLVLGVLHS